MKTYRRVAESGAALVMLLMAMATLPASAQSQETEPDRERLLQFAKAHVAFNTARDEFHGKVGRVHDEDGRQRARVELQRQLAGILVERELTQEEYDEITLAISLDADVRAIFDEILIELASEGSGGGAP